MEMLNIKEVCELNNARDVNQYISAGWMLLSAVAKRDGDSGWIEYSMGWEHEMRAWHPEP